MKKLTQLGTVLLVSIIITACGGGGDKKVSDSATPSGKLIIDAGYGTTNNQHAEKPK